MPEAALIDPGFNERDLRPVDAWRELPSLISAPDQQLIVVWEPPLPRHTYFIGADVSDGIGQDGSVADVVRIATLEAPLRAGSPLRLEAFLQAASCGLVPLF